MAKVSVIVPAYNTELYLPKCVDSIRKQSYRDLEVILVDDGSTDHSAELCDAYAAEDNRFKVIHQSNQGLSRARNNGLDIATGEYIVFVDSDDYVEENMVEELLAAVETTGADMAICNFSQIDEKGKMIRKTTKFQDEGTEPKQLLGRFAEDRGWAYVVVWNKLYKRGIWEKLRFPEDRIREDEWVVLDVYLSCEKVVLVPGTYYNYRMNQGSVMAHKGGIRHLDGVEAVYHRFLKFQQYGWEDQLYNTLICARKMLEAMKFVQVKTKEERDKRKKVIAEYRYMLKNTKSSVQFKYRIVGAIPIIYFEMKRGLLKIEARIHGKN